MSEAIREAAWLALFYDLIFVVAIAKPSIRCAMRHTLRHAYHGLIEFDTP